MIPGVVVVWCGGGVVWWCGFLTDYKTTPTKVVLSCFWFVGWIVVIDHFIHSKLLVLKMK
jgi:hypothetical protein